MLACLIIHMLRASTTKAVLHWKVEALTNWASQFTVPALPTAKLRPCSLRQRQCQGSSCSSAHFSRWFFNCFFFAMAQTGDPDWAWAGSSYESRGLSTLWSYSPSVAGAHSSESWGFSAFWSYRPFAFWDEQLASPWRQLKTGSL